MAISLLFGIVLAIGHQPYYNWLNGRTVGTPRQQQWPLRSGTALATIVSVLLKTSKAVGVAYVQHVWMILRQKSVSLKTLDDVFSLEYNMLSFWNWEMKSSMPLATILTLISWTIPISTLIPPATLSTTRSISSVTEIGPTLGIGISDSGLRYAYWWSLDDTSSLNNAGLEIDSCGFQVRESF